MDCPRDGGSPCRPFLSVRATSRVATCEASGKPPKSFPFPFAGSIFVLVGRYGNRGVYSMREVPITFSMGWPGSSNRTFVYGCCAEIALLGVAALLALPFKRELFDGLFWRASDMVWALAAALPMLLSFGWTLKSPAKFAANIRRFLEHVLRPLFGEWSLAQLAVISLLAGICEETLFRGVLQAGISGAWGSTTGLVVASVAFGLAHAMNREYIIGATAAGFFLGWLFLCSGNLLAPIVAHALYDFFALSWFLRWHKSDPR